MAVTIPDSFCGYVTIEDSRYAFFVNGHFVKLLPAGKEGQDQWPAIIGLIPQEENNRNDYKYIYGYDESLNQIALLQPDSLSHSFIGTSFFAPIIIKSNGNADGFYRMLTKDWKQYDAIVFSGGIIDSLYNPKIAALKRPTLEEQKAAFSNYDGAHSIEIKPFSDYTLDTSIEIAGQKAKLVLSVSQSGGEGNVNTTDLGSLKSFIRLQFDNPQEFITLHRYIQAIKATIAVLAQQNNIDFDVSINQRTEDGKFMSTGICKVFMDSENFYNPQNHQVVPIQSLFDHIPQIIRIVESGEADTILALLPERNKDRKRVTISNVQDLCTALEAEYNLYSSKTSTTKDAAVQQLKKSIKSTIKAFTAENSNIDPDKETTISSCFQYLDLNLKNKIFALYEQHKTAVDGIRQKYSLPDITIESIGEFVKLRNTKAHTGKIAWSESANLYTALFALVYSCFFARADVPSDTIPQVISRMF